VTTYEPAGALLVVETVTTQLAVPPAGGTTVLGEKSIATPIGWPVADRETDEENPFTEFTYTVVVVEAPALTLTVEGDTLIPKSAPEMI
jgi:hypothetical protein